VRGASVSTRTRRMCRISGQLPDGVVVVELDVHRDGRGSFTEVHAHGWGLAFEPCQWSVVESAAGVLRGMYLHRRHEDYLVLVSGRMSIGLCDLRVDTGTSGAACMVTIDEPTGFAVCVPRGVLHGWYFSEPSVHLQGVSEAYDSYSVDDNLACNPNDPDLGLAWPGPIEHLAGRDWIPLSSLLPSAASQPG